MVAMTAERTELPDDRPLTVADLELLPDDGNRYELDDGLLVVSPSPAAGHQAAVLALAVALRAAAPQGFRVLPGLGLTMNPFQHRIPDVLVIKVGDVAFAESSTGKPPALAVEVASPSTASYDRNRKKQVYADFGIRSYWIVVPDIDKPSISSYELRRGDYRLAAEVTGEALFVTTRPFRFEISPSVLVEGPW
jgi:Uma2 family endonuclease